MFKSLLQQCCCFLGEIKMKQPNFELLDSPFRAIYEEAMKSAMQAEKDFFEKHGEPMYCGFAWVTIPNGRSKFVNWCKKIGLGSKHWSKGWYIWNPTGSGTQSMDIKEVGSKAFADVLQKHGIDCYMGSRAD
jgi:hypothetical protein